MKRSFTLLTAAAFLFAVQTNAQSYVERFEGGSIPGCASLLTAYPTTTAGEVIHGTGSLYSNPPVNSSGTRDYISPYLNIASTNLTISYWYKLSESLNGNAKRTLEVGLQSKSGTYTFLDKLTLDKDTPTPMVAQERSINVVAPSTGTYRLVIKMGGDQGNGGVRIIIDDISINADPYYSRVCNSAPVAVNDAYSTTARIAVSDNVITNSVGGSDSDIDGETLAAILVTQPDPTIGSVVMNADGTFTFTPTPMFLGGPVTFTYQLTDNGFDALTSNIATVTINYPDLVPVVLPVKLISFSGTVFNQKAQLKWNVAVNETGERFHVFKSIDGKNFTEIGIVRKSGKSGMENYIYNENGILNGTAYYKLKIINKDNAVSYSDVIVLKAAAGKINDAITLVRNPVVSALDFTYTATYSSQANVVIYNTAGVTVYRSKVSMHKGTNTISLNNTHSLTSGSYILEVSDGTARSVAKLVKQ